MTVVSRFNTDSFLIETTPTHSSNNGPWCILNQFPIQIDLLCIEPQRGKAWLNSENCPFPLQSPRQKHKTWPIHILRDHYSHMSSSIQHLLRVAVFSSTSKYSLLIRPISVFMKNITMPDSKRSRVRRRSNNIASTLKRLLPTKRPEKGGTLRKCGYYSSES